MSENRVSGSLSKKSLFLAIFLLFMNLYPEKFGFEKLTTAPKT
jgi:hypothetical protein